MARDRDDLDDRDDDRPRRRNADLDSVGPLGPLDKLYRDTNVVLLVLFSLCCNGIAFILSLIGFLTAKDPKAKSNAQLSLIISAIVTALGIAAQVFAFMGAAAVGPQPQ